MTGELRKSGIDIIGDVPWGTHICQFYHTKEDLMEILVTYFKTGLENSEFCLWVTSEPVDVEDVKKALRKAMPDFDIYLEKGQIEIIPYTEWFVTDGVFDAQKVSKSRFEKLNHALEKGYEGMRLSGNTSWLEKEQWNSFIEFKAQTDRCMDTYRMINVCTYPLDKHNAAEIIDVVVNHRFALIKRGETWEKIESPKRKQAEEAAIQAARNWEYTFDAVPDLIAILDPGYKIVRANKAMAASLGLTPQACTGLTCYQAVHGMDEPPEFCPYKQLLNDGHEHIKEVHEESLGGDFIVSVSPLYDSEGNVSGCIHVARDINERKKAEEALRKKEQCTRQTLEKVLSPSREMIDFELSEVIDVEAIRPVMENFFKLTNIPIGLNNLKGDVLVGAGWQDICTKFHRVNPESCKLCKENDIELSEALLPGKFKLQRCKNNMCDIGTPIMVEGQKVGSVFAGQFFFEDEPPDYEVFRAQARKYGFNEEEYIAALDRVPRIDRELVNNSMGFFIAFASMISQLSYSNFKLAQSLTERDTLVSALQESEERFRSVLENSLDAAYRRDLQNDCYDYMSPVIEKITGFSLQELNAMNTNEFLECIHPDDRHLVTTEMGNSVNQGFGTLEYRFKCKGGEYRWLSESFSVIKAQNGTPLFRAGTIRDITERKQAEEALQESESFLRLAQTSASAGIWNWNISIDKLEWSEELFRLFGLNPDTSDSSFDLWRSILHPEDKLITEKSIVTAINNRTPISCEYRIVFPSGEIRWINALGNTIYDSNGKPQRVSGICTDITERKQVEEALQESEARLQMIIANSPDIIFEQNRELRYVWIFNPTPPLSVSDVLGKTDEELLPQEEARLLTSIKRRVIGTGLPEQAVVSLTYGRESRWFETIYEPKHDETGKVSGILSYTRDITERKEAEMQLKEAHDNLEELVKARTLELEEAYNSVKEIETSLSEAQEIAHIGNWDWNIVTGRIYWSDELFRIFGLSLRGSGLLYKEFLNYVHPEDQDYVNSSFKKNPDGRFSSMDFRIILKDGRERLVHSENEIVFDEKKIPIRIRGTVQDITEKKRAEEKLRESEEKYRNIVETANEIILITSNEEIITYANKKIADMLGYPPEEVIGNPIWGFISEEYRSIVKLNLEKRRQGISESYEAKLSRKDGSSVWVLLNAKPLFDREGRYIGAMSMLTDITKRKEAEETLANIETARKKEIHHRIKNNLQVISSLLDLQVEKFGNKEHFEKSEVIKAFRESQDRVASIALIHEELHEEKGTNTLNFSPYLRRLVENLFQTYTVRDANISLNIDLEEDIYFDMDIAVPLGLIVNEIVSNSLKYAFSGKDNGFIQIKLQREKDEKSVGKLLDEACQKETTSFILSVSDNGKGLPENFKIENSKSLGLQLITILIDQLEGKLELKGENGTEFVIKFAVPEGE